MSTINLDFNDDIAIIELNRPKANAINQALVHDLQQALSKLGEADHVRGAILTASGTIFCAGLDLIQLYDFKEDEMDRFWESFGKMIQDFIEFPKPLIAAINGHAPAGGCVLALCCDHRIMADGASRIGLNEVAAGVVPPRMIVELARARLGPLASSRLLLNSLLLLPGEALQFGLVEEVCPQDTLRERAETKMRAWLQMPSDPWRYTKRYINAPLAEMIREMAFADAFGDTIREWWSAESRQAVQETIMRLRGGKK